MHELTERQKVILEIVIREHIGIASPISSGFIEKKYNLGISPATIRAELYELIEKGYLYQPHTSSGRVPTDKGYRFFVDLLAEEELKELEKKLTREIRKMQEEIKGKMRFMREFTRFLAHTSSGLTVSYFPKENVLFKEGWEEVFQGPEFENIKKIHDFTGMVNDFETNIDFFLEDNKEKCVRVYIGGETPFSKKRDFSILISPCKIMRKKGLLAIIGPKRMAYDRNIGLVNAIIKMLKE